MPIPSADAASIAVVIFRPGNRVGDQEIKGGEIEMMENLELLQQLPTEAEPSVVCWLTCAYTYA